VAAQVEAFRELFNYAPARSPSPETGRTERYLANPADGPITPAGASKPGFAGDVEFVSVV
jgi:hypothetical protein